MPELKAAGLVHAAQLIMPVIQVSIMQMKKTFQLTHPKIKAARLADSVRRDVKRYLKRERNKALPDGADFWDFDCRFGNDASQAAVIPLQDINRHIDAAEAAGLESFYLEVLARPGYRKTQND